MFTIAAIELAHSKVKSGADFPKYIQELKRLGITAFETWVKDSHTVYFGEHDFQLISKPQYDELIIKNESNKDQFNHYLKIHQQGQTDYITFCKHCAETGVKKWIVNLYNLTCTYYDQTDNEILTEKIPE